MKRLRKAAEKIAKFSANNNEMKDVPIGYDIINFNAQSEKSIMSDPRPFSEMIMHKEGSVKHIYNFLKTIK